MLSPTWKAPCAPHSHPLFLSLLLLQCGSHCSSNSASFFGLPAFPRSNLSLDCVTPFRSQLWDYLELSEWPCLSPSRGVLEFPAPFFISFHIQFPCLHGIIHTAMLRKDIVGLLCHTAKELRLMRVDRVLYNRRRCEFPFSSLQSNQHHHVRTPLCSLSLCDQDAPSLVNQHPRT